MKTCEGGTLIAEKGMKCDHDVELVDECLACEDAAEKVLRAVEEDLDARRDRQRQPEEG